MSKRQQQRCESVGNQQNFELLSDRRDLTENLALRIEPIIERIAFTVSPLGMELIGPLRNQDMEVIAGRNRLTRARSIGSCCLGWRARRRSWSCLFCLA
jgi:hypothetical protein